jgi:type IV pilus assembly protein PilM
MAFLKFFSKKQESVIGLDIGSSSIKVVELIKKDDSIELLTYGLLEISPYGGKEIGRAVKMSVDKTVEAITDLMREAKVKSLDSGVAIPFKSSFMRLIEVPQVTEKELEKIVPLEARKYIPVPIEEVSLDWSLVPQVPGMLSEAGNNYINILLVAVHNDVLSRFQKITEKTKLENKFLEVESYSSMRSIAPESNEALMLCDFGASSTKVYVLYKGFVLVSHVINTGSQDISLNISRSMDMPIDQAEMIKREKGISQKENDEVAQIIDLTLSQVTSELIQTKEDFESKYNTPITKTLLIGGGAQLKGLKEVIEKSLKIEVQKGDAFNQIKTPNFLKSTMEEIGPEFAVAVGCALRMVSK